MILLAMDRATVRRYDDNGYLHVEVSNISKANVCPYLGREIPNWQALGLDAERVYQLYRDPEELAAAATTFNNVPLLSEHIPVIPEQLPEELIIGSTGTDAAFSAPYLRNSLVIWSAALQRRVENEEQREISCGYRYRADMTPGTNPEGLEYDGVMRDIVGNHVALVFEGRAGPDVVVGDNTMKLKSRTALMITGALASYIRPRLAQDAKVDISAALKDVDAKSFAMDGAPEKIAKKAASLAKKHLAADASIDIDDLTAHLSAIQPLALDEDKIAEDEDEDEIAEDEDVDGKQAEDENPEAEDEEDDEDDDGKKPAMDTATVRKMIAAAEERGAKRVAHIELAKRDVSPLVGEVVGMDSAEAIYRFALDSVGFDANAIKDIKRIGLKAMVDREVERAKAPARIALDSASVKRANDSFAELYGSN